MILSRYFIWIVAFLFAAPVVAQSVVLTEGSSGRPLIVNGGQALPANSAATKLSPTEIVRTFLDVCTPNPLAGSPESTGNLLAFDRADQNFPAEGKNGPVTVRSWLGPNATLSIYEGSSDALRGKPIAIVERAYVTTGLYGPFKATLPQCNLVITLTNFESAKALAVELQAQLGQAKKMVVKETWADAKWEKFGPDENLAISMTAPVSRTGLQPVHLSVYIKK